MVAASSPTFRPFVATALAAALLGVVAYTTRASADDKREPMILDTKVTCIPLDASRKYVAEEAMMLIGSSAEQNPAEGSFVVIKKLYINVKTKKAALITEAPTEGFACLIEALDNFVFAKPKS